MTVVSTPSLTISGNGLANPWGIAFDASGDLWVANLGDDSIKKFSTTGTLLSPTISEAAFSFPTGVALDNAGNLWVANANTNTIAKFSSTSGVLLGTLAVGLNGPRGLTFDTSGNLWVSNYSNNTIVEFDSSGTLIQTLSPMFLSGPTGLAFDTSGDLWVSNYSNNTLVEFDSSTGALMQILSSGLNGPVGLAFDTTGHVWVANSVGNTIQEISATGTLMQTLLGVNTPRGLAFDASGDLWVTNYYGNTIQEFLNIPSTPSSSNTITVAGQNLSQNNVTNGSSLSSGNGSVITFAGSLSSNGGAAQNNPLSAQNISNVSAGQVNTMPTLMAVKIQKIIGLIGAVTAEMAESMSHSSGLLASSDSTKIAGSSMIAPPNATVPAEAITQAASDTPMEATAYPVYGYNYFYLSDFQGSSNFRVTSQSSNPLTTNFLELINNTGGNQNVDLSGYQGIVVATGGVNITGLTANNYLGTFGGGSYTFGAGNQKLFLMGPNSSIVGGSGIDTVRFLGVGKGGAFINQQGNDVTIWSDWLDTGSGVTYLHNVARAQFDDGSVAFDTGAGQNAGEVFRLYEAAFHRVGDQQGMGYWINQLDNGTSLQAVANQFLSSQEFINLYGSSTSSAQYVTALYNNVLGRAPDATGAAYWQSQLQAGASKAQILIQFAESVEGVSHTASQMAHGVQYQQWVQ